MDLLSLFYAVLALLFPSYSNEQLILLMNDSALSSYFVDEQSVMASGIMPLDFSSSDSAALGSIQSKVVDIENFLRHGTGALGAINRDINSQTTNLQSAISTQTTNLQSSISTQTSDLQTFFSSPWLVNQGYFSAPLIGSNGVSSGLTFGDFLQSLVSGIVYPTTSGFNYVSSNGSLGTSNSNMGLIDLINANMKGLASIFRGVQGSAGSIMNSQYTGSMMIQNSDGSKVQSTSYSVSGGFPMINRLLSQIQFDTGSLAYVLANKSDIELKEQELPNQNAFEEGFLGNSAGSLTTRQIGDLSGVSGDLKTGLAGDVTAGQAISGSFGGNGWGFFSQQVQDELNPQYSAAQLRDRLLRSNDGYVDFYDPNAYDRYLEELAS